MGDTRPSLYEAVLVSMYNVEFIEMVHHSGSNNGLKCLADYAGEADWAVIIYLVVVTFLVYGGDMSRFPIIW